MKPVPKAFNVLLGDTERGQLAQLADVHHRSQGAVIRYLIRLGHSMTILGIPRCANGTACLVPHLHRPTPDDPTGGMHP